MVDCREGRYRIGKVRQVRTFCKLWYGHLARYGGFVPLLVKIAHKTEGTQVASRYLATMNYSAPQLCHASIEPGYFFRVLTATYPTSEGGYLILIILRKNKKNSA